VARCRRQLDGSTQTSAAARQHLRPGAGVCARNGRPGRRPPARRASSAASGRPGRRRLRSHPQRPRRARRSRWSACRLPRPTRDSKPRASETPARRTESKKPFRVPRSAFRVHHELARLSVPDDMSILSASSRYVREGLLVAISVLVPLVEAESFGRSISGPGARGPRRRPRWALPGARCGLRRV
jgi:hypothetical protein